MGLIRFILGVLGILLIIGAFSSFFPLLLLGGLASGSVGFAFAFPISLMVLGAAMVYFGFYYRGSTQTSNSQLKWVAKWGVINTVAILLANYVINRLSIDDILLVTIFTAIMVSIVAQIVRSHKSNFKLKWFIFYFLVYANIIWVMGEYIIPKIAFQTSLFSSIVVGFALAGVIAIIQRLNMRHHSVQWVSIILAIILLIANLESLQLSPLKHLLEQSTNSSELSEDKRDCPTADLSVLNRPLSEVAIEPEEIGPALNKAIDTSIWKIEGDVRTCYKGRYKGQYPDWFYCDDMIVSRWETSSSGTIKYRWYSAVTAEWHPEEGKTYVFGGFSCENGKAVQVDKEKPSIYVHDSKDGTVINVHISRDGTETTIDY